MTNEEVTLKDVVDRLDQLIVLWKLTHQEMIEKVRKEIEKDLVSMKILELADGTKEYTVLVEEVAKVTGKSTRTVKGRISELAGKGVIRGIRKGGKVYYQPTSIFD
jgi:predicted transcriptional regulator